MTDQSMFDEQPKQPETPANPQLGSLEDLLAGIRNENGEQKYKDVATALQGLKNSQQFIETLKREKREVEEREARARAELEKMGTIDDYVNRLKPQTATPNSEPKTVETKGLSEEQVAQLLEQRLTAREMEQTKAANLQQIENHLTQTHGDQAVEFLKTRARELNMTVTDLKELAQRTPSAALQLLGASPNKPANPTQSSGIPPRNNPNTLEPPKFDRSVVHGGLTSQEVKDRWNASKDYTFKRLNIES